MRKGSPRNPMGILACSLFAAGCVEVMRGLTPIRASEKNEMILGLRFLN
jgi:hypothetical protein